MISEVTVTKTGSPDPQTAHVEMDMVFNAARTSVAVANFVPIPVKDDKGNCCVATIYLTSGNGQYDAGTGSMAISSVLLFDISNIFAADSTLPLRLTTNPPRGSVVDTTGNVVLAGTDTFPDGYLKGKTAFVTLTGQIRPHHPWWIQVMRAPRLAVPRRSANRRQCNCPAFPCPTWRSDSCRRSGAAGRARLYLLVLLFGAQLKNSWRIAEQAGDTSPDGTQRLLNFSAWDADQVRDDSRGCMLDRLGDPAGVVVVADETGFLEKGSC